MIESILRMLLKPCPAEGNGVHKWAYYAACRCIDMGVTDDDAIPAVEAMMTRDPKPENEVESAFQSARGERPSTYGKWPKVSDQKIAAAVAGGPTLLELWDSSPVKLSGTANRTEEFIDALFPGNPLLCVGQTNRVFDTLTREEWRGALEAKQLLVPSPMTARKGRTKSGKPSAHTLDNTGPRQYLTIEFDQGGLDSHAAILNHLSKSAPLAMVVFSGSKSLHGWFYGGGRPEEQLLPFMQKAVMLGADRATWGLSQFVRMPDGQRVGKCNPDALPAGFPRVPVGRQAVIYFNPEVMG